MNAPLRTVRGLVFALTLTLTGCASGGSGSSGGGDTARGSSTHIIEAEFATVPQLSAFEAVRRLRPAWLNTRTGAPPQVHIDGRPQGAGLESLLGLPASDVLDMTYMNAADATTRFGTNYISGVILVRKR